MKFFKLDGLNFFVKAKNKGEAVLKCLANHWGVTEKNLIEVERIPVDASRVI